MSAATYVTASDQKVTLLPGIAQAPSGLYVDLEGNQLSASALAKLGRNITCLNLNRNPLVECSLPLLKRLRSLTVDNCGLTSFNGIPAFINLRFLSASNNQLRTYEGLHIFPRLTYANLSGNPFDFCPVLSVQAFGSIYLKIFNDVELTERQVRAAFTLSPLVGIALRHGRDPSPLPSPDDELEASRHFFTGNLVEFLRGEGITRIATSLEAVPVDDGLGFVLAWESPSIRWFRGHSPCHGPEWVPVIRIPDDRSPPNVLPITQLLQMHMVRCEFVLKGRPFTIYTDYPIGRQPGHLSLPFPLDPGVTGVPIEGSLISLIPLDVPTRVDWTCSGDSIARDVPSMTLTHHQVDNNVTCFLEPYSPHFNSISFSVVYAQTEVVDPQLPVVSEIAFPPLIVEGELLKFTRTMVPEREGDSVIFVERSKSIGGSWVKITDLSPDRLEYTATADDIGSFLRISYTPHTAQGVVSETHYSYSDSRVLPAIPVFRNAVIGGLPKSFYPMVALGDYSGGRKGPCSINWYFSRVAFTPESFKTAELVAENTMFFTPDAKHIDGYLAAQMIPVRCDNVVGEIVYPAISKPLVESKPPIPLANVPAEAREGVRISFDETVSWLLSDLKAFCGFLEVKRGVSFTPRARDVGRVLRIVTDESDHIVGEILRADPVVSSLRLDYERAQVGLTATALIEPVDLFPERCEIIWMKVEGPVVRAISYDTTTYVFAKEDIGFQVKVRVTPVAIDGSLRPFTETALTPAVVPGTILAPTIVGSLVEAGSVSVEYSRASDQIIWLRSDPEKKWVPTKVKGPDYQIQPADLGRYLRAQLTVGDSMLFATSADVVQPQPPSVTLTAERLTATEGELLAPGIRYSGGKEGDSVMIWKRFAPGQALTASTARLSPSGRLSRATRDRDKLLEDDGTVHLSTAKSYRVVLADVGSTIIFSYTPVRSDMVVGETVTLTFGPVAPLPPSVKDVIVQQNAEGGIECIGQYSGGQEGASVYEWRGTTTKGRPINLGLSSVNVFHPPPDFTDYEIEAVYTPVRADGVRGKSVASGNKCKVQPLPKVEGLELLLAGDRIVVGSLIRCKATVSAMSHPLFQWCRGTGDGTWVRIDGAKAADYTTTAEDAGLFLLCSVQAINKQGWKGPAVSAVSAAKVESGEDPLRISVHKGRYQTGMVLGTNVPDKDVVWERQTGGDWEFICERPTYLLSVSDVGRRIRAALGDFESEPTPPIILRPSLMSYVKAAVRAKTFKFSAMPKIGKTVWQAIADVTGVTFKAKGPVGEKTGKWATLKFDAVPGTRDEMVIWLDPSVKFVVTVSISGDQRLMTAIGDHGRDFIGATLAEYAKASPAA